MRFIKFVLLIFIIVFVLVVSLVTIPYTLIPRVESPVSILVLGKGGEGHTAPDLTDTIMVATLNSDSHKINIFSLPRDIWVDSTRAKLNSSYYWDKQKGGKGFDLAATSVNEITGIMPKYTVVVDFSLFKDFIDTIGGVEVNVENSFIDEKYPILGKENDLCSGDKLYKCRYETLQFTRGMQYMDGETALKFVRSRNSVGDEGTDLAREKRQQVLISAIKNKILSTDFLFNFKSIKSLYNVVTTHVETNMDRVFLQSLFKELISSRNNINFLTIPEEFLKISQNEKKYDRQYVFVPKSGTWKELQDWIAKII
jgi:LCP family protein required for cell wall assembly